MDFFPSFLRIFSVATFVFFLLNFFAVDFGSHAQFPLPTEEVELLQTISQKMNNTIWNNITQNSCQRPDWNKTEDGGLFESYVYCSSLKPVCHLNTIRMKGFGLSGVIPAEFGQLTHLVELDLTRNYLSGPIPKEIFQLPNLEILALLGNKFNGSIPPQIGNIATLKELVLEDNMFEGALPSELGNLRHLSRLLLSANNLTGSIPETYAKLKNLTEFRLDGNTLSGQIPGFIGNWTKLDILHLQGTSMEGPIPDTISLLKSLTELRISDLKGSSSEFPNLEGMTIIKILVLRNCMITGSIPEHIGSLKSLKQLDLSFNRLTGPIPPRFDRLEEDINFIFLTNNSLNGSIPDWMLSSKQKFDLSYNNFTGPTSNNCQVQTNVNLVSSYSSPETSEIAWCFRKDLTCSVKPQYHSLFINCGGNLVEFEGDNYEADTNTEGPSVFSSVSEKWAYSSTGRYTMSNAQFLATNSFNLSVTGGDIYKTARLAPQSLKYYGLCMLPGSYKVQLHFAEIMFSNEQNFSSLGRRIFDVLIQGSEVLKDFNIADKAGGVGIGHVETFDNIMVTGTTLEIHLYWSGKGTNAIPRRGVYGPLISAITVTPNFKVDRGGLSVGAIFGLVSASCVAVSLILALLRWKGYLGGKDLEDEEIRGLELQTGYFTLRQIKHATNNFDPSNKIGEGGFGPVYKGLLSDGSVIAVKQLSAKSKQGNREFVNEVGMISAVQHPNLVRLFGCCIEGNQLLLVYEYLENNSLSRALFGPQEQRLHLDWSTRKRILLGIAKGLTYLHEESRLKIVHRDIKASNVLLDRDLNAKISDFGLAKLDNEENTHISTRVAGTIGYMAPEYAMRGYLTDKADVYSFGIVALETVSGKSNTNYRPREKFVYLLDWAYVLQEQGNMLELVDPILESNYSKKEVTTVLNLALLCTNPSPTLRPLMSSVVSMIEGKIPVQAPIIKRNSAEEDARFTAFEIQSHDSQTHISQNTSSNQSHSQKGVSLGGPWIDPSSSRLLEDLYDVDLE